MTGHREPSDAEVDAAFDEIVARISTTPSAPLPLDHVTSEPTTVPDEPVQSVDDGFDDPIATGWRSHELADPDSEPGTADELWAEVPRDPLPPWRPAPSTIAAFVLIAAAFAVAVLVGVGVRLPAWATWGSPIAVLAAAALLLARLPRHRDDSDDNGARV